MARRAGDAFLLEGSLLGHSLGQVAGEQGDRAVAALAVTRVLYALLVDQRVDVLQIPGGAEAVRVHGLTPLVIGLLVAVAAVLGGGEDFGTPELAVDGGGVRRQEGRLLAEGVVVTRGDRVVEGCGGAVDRGVCAV